MPRRYGRGDALETSERRNFAQLGDEVGDAAFCSGQTLLTRAPADSGGRAKPTLRWVKA
jgi:hypothetical protein